MQLNEKYEREFNLKDLLFHILRHWRSIVIIMLVAAIAIGGIQFYKNVIIKDNQDEKNYQEKLAQYHQERERLEREIEKQESILAFNQAYLDGSKYMELDPKQVHYAKRSYSVQVDPEVYESLPSGKRTDPVKEVLPVYSSIMDQAFDEEELQEAFGTTNIAFIRESSSISYDLDTNMITLTAWSGSEEQAIKAREFLDKQVKIATQRAQDIIPHTLKLVSEGTYDGFEKDTLDAINNWRDSVITSETAIKSARDTLNSLKEPKKVNTGIGDRILLGLLIGFVAALFGLAGGYMLSGKLHNGRELSKQYGIPVYGNLKLSGSNRKENGLDKLIDKWEFHDDRKTDDAVYQNICSLLNVQNEAGKVLLVSTRPEKDIQAVQENLQTRLEGKDVVLAADFLTNSTAIQEAAEADTVLLVEKKNQTRNSDVAQMANMLRISKAKVVGAIIL